MINVSLNTKKQMTTRSDDALDFIIVIEEPSIQYHDHYERTKEYRKGTSGDF